MRYEGALIRPPSESQSLILQVTVGCSHNQCTYCGLYRDREFRIKNLDDVRADIREGTHFRFRRVFLADGDVLIAPTDHLVSILETIRSEMPFVERVSCFADARSILKKSLPELVKLRDLGLTLLYVGLDSGDEQTLASMNRGCTVSDTIESAKRIHKAGIQLSAIALLGLGGRKNSHRHATATAAALNQMEPEFIGIVTTLLDEDAPLFELAERGDFQLPSRLGLLEEMATILEGLTLRKGLLTANHSSNYLPLRVVLPYQRQDAIKYIRQILDTKDESILKPDFLRNLH